MPQWFEGLRWVSQLGPLDWPNLIGGFALGLIPIVFPVVLSHIKGVFSQGRRRYYGKYIMYHRSGTKPEVIRGKHLRLYRDFLGKDTIYGPKDPFTNLSYKGRFYSQKGMLYLLLSTSRGEDDMFAIFYEPVDGDLTATSGVLSALNFDGKPTAFTSVLSKRHMEDAAVSRMIPKMPITMDYLKYRFYEIEK